MGSGVDGEKTMSYLMFNIKFNYFLFLAPFPLIKFELFLMKIWYEWKRETSPSPFTHSIEF